MKAKLCAFVIWALVAASAVFWALRLGVGAPAAPPGTVTVETTTAARGDLTRLFGAAPVPVAAVASVAPESTRFRLTGVMAPRPLGADRPVPVYGVALIGVDGKPPRAYKVGARIDGDLVLQSVSLRSASVGSAGAPPSFKLELPLLPAPATGTLPPVNFNPQASYSAVPQFQQFQQSQQSQQQQAPPPMMAGQQAPPMPLAEPPVQNLPETEGAPQLSNASPPARVPFNRNGTNGGSLR